LPQPISRRHLLTSSAAAAGLAAAGAFPTLAVAQDGSPATAPPPAAEQKLKIGVVGIGGQGHWHVTQVLPIKNAEIVALCDVDANMLVRAARMVPKAATFTDFRDMLKDVKDLDAVLIATPDHTHAPIAAACLRGGKHVYCEKPLTHTVREARTISDLAKQSGLCTQMGIQIHAMDNYKRVVELVKAGAVGKITEVIIWNNRNNRPASTAPVPVPARLNYDLWLGPVPPRPFVADYHPYNWRRHWAFGEGMLGDIGCHLMDVAFWALDLQHPTRVEALGGAPLDDQITSEWIIAQYDFPARGDMPAVKLTWYDPPKQPPMLASWNLPEKFRGEGVVFVGEGGKLLYTNYGEHALLPEAQFKDYQRPPKSIPSSPGHQQEWVNACLKKDPKATATPFEYGALLTESALLGTVAFRAQKPLEWDAAAMKITNAPEVERMLDYDHREGWKV
jgi:predicted dehydrogenase